MRRHKLKTAIGALSLAVLATTAPAHPGHVHGPGLVHGFSWPDLLAYLAAAIVPVVVLARSLRVRVTRRWRRD